MGTECRSYLCTSGSSGRVAARRATAKLRTPRARRGRVHAIQYAFLVLIGRRSEAGAGRTRRAVVGPSALMAAPEGGETLGEVVGFLR